MIRYAAIAMLVLAFAGAARARPSGCPISQGYSGQFTAGYVNWFTWNGADSFMLVLLTNGQYHGFPDIPRATASAFSQLAATQTQSFYLTQIAPHSEALLYEKPSFSCPLEFETPPGPAVFLRAGTKGRLLVGRSGRMIAIGGGPASARAQGAVLWTR